MKVKTFLLTIIILLLCLFSTPTHAQLDSSSFSVTIKVDTVFRGVDSSYITIGIDGADGRILIYNLTRVDSIWAIKQVAGAMLMINVPDIVRTHYYLPDGNKIWANQDVWILNKVWFIAN